MYRVQVITEKGETSTSFLLLQNARPSDSGIYQVRDFLFLNWIKSVTKNISLQCNPSNAKSRSVTVHVLNGKRLLIVARLSCNDNWYIMRIGIVIVESCLRFNLKTQLLSQFYLKIPNWFESSLKSKLNRCFTFCFQGSSQQPSAGRGCLITRQPNDTICSFLYQYYSPHFPFSAFS